MSDIFVSYSRADRARVAPLVEALEAQGWIVWWDRSIEVGESFDEMIDAEIVDTSVVLVVWTKDSINSRWVRNEALEGLDRGILVPVMLDEVRIPVAFRQSQVAKLLHWPWQVDDDEFHRLVDTIATRIDSKKTRPYQSPRRPRIVKYAAAAVASMLIAVVLAVLWAREPVRGPPESTVAVMRFEGAPGDDARDLADDISDELRTLLRSSGLVSVTPRTAAWSVDGDVGLIDAGQRLGARYLVSGTVLLRDEKALIELSVADSSDGATIWRRDYESSTSDLLSLNGEIAAHVMGALQLPIESARNRMSEGRTRNREAYAFYLRSKEQLRYSAGAEELNAARDLLHRAVALDPEFGDAFAALCRAQLTIYEQGRDTQQFEAAERACHRAVTLKSRDENVRIALGNLYLLSGQADKAKNEFMSALSDDPASADAYIGLGDALGTTGDVLRAEDAYQAAVERQPGYWQAFNALGSFYLQSGRLDEAIDAFGRMVYLAPENPWGFNNLGAARFFSGDFQGAIRDWKRASTLKVSRAALSNMGSAYFHLRQFAEAVDMYRQALEVTPNDHRLWGNIGDAYRHLPDREKEAKAAYARQLDLAQENLNINGRDAGALSRMGVSYSYLGDEKHAVSAVTRALNVAPADMAVLYDVAVTYLTLGETETALDMLRRAIVAGYARVQLTADPFFDTLREVPAYSQLLQ